MEFQVLNNRKGPWPRAEMAVATRGRPARGGTLRMPGRPVTAGDLSCGRGEESGAFSEAVQEHFGMRQMNTSLWNPQKDALLDAVPSGARGRVGAALTARADLHPSPTRLYQQGEHARSIQHGGIGFQGRELRKDETIRQNPKRISPKSRKAVSCLQAVKNPLLEAQAALVFFKLVFGRQNHCYCIEVARGYAWPGGSVTAECWALK